MKVNNDTHTYGIYIDLKKAKNNMRADNRIQKSIYLSLFISNNNNLFVSKKKKNQLIITFQDNKNQAQLYIPQ